MVDKLLAEPGKIHRVFTERVNLCECLGGLSCDRRIRNRKQIILSGKPSCFGHGFRADLPAVRGAEVEQGKRVPHSAIGKAGDQQRRVIREGKPLLPADIEQPVGDHAGFDPLKIEPLAAGEDGRQNLVDFGGSQNKDDMFGRFLQDFQQRIHCAWRKHVALIEDVNPVFCYRGHEVGFLAELPDVIHPVVARRVDLRHVEDRAVVDPAADLTFIAGVPVRRVQAVDRLGDDLGTGGLPGPAGTGEQVGVGKLPGRNLIFQGQGDMVLANHPVEIPRAPFPV